MKYYKDIKVKYFIFGIIGALLIILLMQGWGILTWILVLVYMIACVIFFEYKGLARTRKLIDIMNEECRIRDFIAAYQPLREKSVTSVDKETMDLNLSTAYIHLGEIDEALKYLKRYHEGEEKGKYEYIANKKTYRRVRVLQDGIYHNNMAAVYVMLQNFSEAEKMQAELKSDLERLSSESAGAVLERGMEVRRIELAIEQGDLDDYENMALYINRLMSDNTAKTLARVRYQYMLYKLYTAVGKPEEAEAARAFVLKNGGDSCYVDGVGL